MLIMIFGSLQSIIPVYIFTHHAILFLSENIEYQQIQLVLKCMRQTFIIFGGSSEIHNRRGEFSNTMMMTCIFI